jgi:glycosyltransferase involved in cell wall biosynthesis
MQKLGVEVILIPISRGPASAQTHSPTCIIPAQPNWLHYLLDGLSVPKIVRSVIAKKQVDAVLSWGHDAAFIPGILESKNVVFGMIAAHPSYSMWMNRQTGLKLLKNLTDEWFRFRPLKRADITFALSNFTREELITLFGLESERVIVTYWGVDAMFAQVQRSFAGEVSRLIFYGSLEPLKGIFDLIEALARVASLGQRNWILKVAGWDHEEQVKHAAQKHGVGDQVILLGRLDHPTLTRELEWAQLAILPSRAESFGLAIAEAQASGLPVVSYEAGSVPEVVKKNVTGWLVPPYRVDQLAEAIIEAMQDPQKTFRMGLAGRERVTRLFSWEQTAVAMLQGIEEAKRRRA